MQEYTYPSVSVNATNPSVGTNGTTAPGSSTLIGGKYASSSDLIPVSVDSSGNVNVNSTIQGTPNINIADVAGSAPSATNGLAARITNGTSYVDPTQIRDLTSGTDSVTADQGGTWTVQPGNTANTTPWLATINQGGNSADVTASNALKVDASATTQPVSGTVTADQGGTWTVDQGGSWTVTADQGGTWNINNISGTISLPTGAATSANQSSEITQLTDINSNTSHLPTALGQTTMSASMPVAIASDQSAFKASLGRANANAPVYNVYSSTNIDTSAYVQLVASTTNTTNYLDIFDSSGQAMILATGVSGSEVVLAYVPPGGDQIPVAIPSGTRVAYKALTANATSGYLLMNFWS